MISTVNAIIGSTEMETGFHVTTPEAPQVQSYLAQMVTAGLTHAVLEATSHGLAQHRVAGCDFDAAVVTNITHEHLDYHGSYPSYREAKARLVDMVARKPAKPGTDLRLAVLNRDDVSYEFLFERLKRLSRGVKDAPRIINYGLSSDAQVTAKEIDTSATGTSFTVTGGDLHFPVMSPLLGEYNVLNCLAAIALTVVGMGVDYGAAQEGIHSLAYIPGRMERLDSGLDFLTVVDFAHTPNALRNALLAVRQILNAEGTGGKVIAVFGSAGLRDRAKRRMMAEASVQYADLTVLTAEDPRTESLETILAEMVLGCKAAGGVENTTFWQVQDRGEAIRFGFTLAQPGDAVVVLGKGHEQSMCFGDVEYPWDDRLAVRAAAAEFLGIPEPRMPYLPTQK
jgi:UDP-N-acetylmuramoyl-L-alanyl-D-glutamate--2,6-diaminopimelate ligase